MLKKRIIPKLQIKKRMIGNRELLVLVTSKNFTNYVEIGDPVSQAKIYQNQAADELIIVDIDASLENRKSLLTDLISKAAKEIFMPLTVGGGVKNMEDFRLLLNHGADKVCINSSAILKPELMTQAANAFGDQCVVLSIDYRIENEKPVVFSHCGSVRTDKDPVSWAKEGESRGAGEILLTSIDRDGTRTGLDLKVLREITESVKIPVIASGGCGLASHFSEGFVEGNADAVSAGTYFCFKDENLLQVRSQVKNSGVPIRMHL